MNPLLKSILDEVATLVGGREVIHSPGKYGDWRDSKSSPAWGWNQGQKIQGRGVCVMQPSPQHKGDKLVAYVAVEGF